MTRHESEVAHYYRRNTEWFRAWEGSRTLLPIHRRVWAPGIRDKAEALEFVHSRIAFDLVSCDIAFDLGCGVGAALESLSRGAQSQGTGKKLIGLNLSDTQVEKARESLGSAAEVRHGSYMDPTFYGRPAGRTLFFAIESLAHAEDAELFCAVIDSQARTGDLVAVCDDLIHRGPGTSFEKRLLRVFAQGWKAPDLQSSGSLGRRFAALGWRLRRDEDWSDWAMPRGVLRAFGCRLALFLPGKGPFFANLKGGAALVLAHRRKIIAYRYMVWEKA